MKPAVCIMLQAATFVAQGKIERKYFNMNGNIDSDMHISAM
jgi:hypothetical protein